MIRRKLLWSAGLLAALAAGLGADLGGMRARAADALGLAPAPDFKLQGQLTQGGYAFGQAPAGAQAVTFNGKPVALAADGRFLIAFDRDSGPVGGLSVRLANGQTLGAPVAISKRAWQLDFRLAAIRRKTGGAGVVLLTATPAKNSPLEYYNVIQFIDPKAFSRRGLDNPEQFIDRYLKIVPQNVISVTGDTAVRSAVTGFMHLGELREIIFRYGEFASVPVINKRYPQAKIALPKLSFPEAVVEMDDDQEEKYDRMVSQMEKMIDTKENMGDLLGLLARLSLIAVHAQLDEGYGWNTALGGGVSRRKVSQNSLDGWIEIGRASGRERVSSPV